MKYFPDNSFSYGRHKNLSISLLWVLRKKGTFACAIFLKICYIACVISHTGKLICLHAYLNEGDHVGLTDKLELPPVLIS